MYKRYIIASRGVQSGGNPAEHLLLEPTEQMFYRRKILLALLEACGGELNNTDMEKLLFVYCMEREINYYDFFPYRFGCFSFLSYQDKRVLTQQGYLSNVDNFKLRLKKSFAKDLEVDDRHFLIAFALRTRQLRGDALVRHVYLKYPHYACRSEIKNRILTDEELAMIDACQPEVREPCLFTIGYEGLTIDAYIDKLIRHSVAMVIDVRRNPISRKYGFSKTRFRSYLERAHMAYEHIPELGVASSQRKNLETAEDYHTLFEEYASTTLPRCEAELERISLLLNTHRRVALTCFEAEAISCHRHRITESLHRIENWNNPIVHIQ